MVAYEELSKEELLQLKSELEAQFDEVKAKNLKLDMSRGKPSKEQLELSMPMMDVLTSETPLVSRGGTDIRNYGVIDGITEGQEFIASLVGLGPEAYDNVIVYGNASLNIMYDCISRSMMFGVNGSMVQTTVCNGKVLMKDREVLVCDEAKVMADCRQAAKELADDING